MAETVKQECYVRTQERPCWRVRVARAAALTLRRTRSNEGCSQLSVRPTELELRRSHPVQQVHRAFRCLDRLKFFSHAQRDSPLTMIRVYVYHYTLLAAIGHSSNARPGLQAQPPFCAATKYPPTGSTLSELASVSGVGGCALKPLGTKRLPGAEGPSETKRKRKAEVLFSSSRFLLAELDMNERAKWLPVRQEP